MYQQLKNNTCYDQFKTSLQLPTNEQSRVYPFLNPQIIYNDTINQYKYDTDNCIIPNQTLSSFNIDGNSCILKSNGSIGKSRYLTKTNNGCVLKVTELDTYNNNMSILQKAIDYDYLDAISKLEADIVKKRENIVNIQKNIDTKMIYLNALRRGSVIAGDDISKFQNKKAELLKQWPIIYNKYNIQKNIFDTEQNNYNKLVDKLTSYVDLVNNKEYSIMLFEECWWGGWKPVIKIGINQPSVTMPIPYNIGLSGVGGFPNKIKLILTDAAGKKVEIREAISCLVDVGFNDRAKTITIERINPEVNNFEKQSDLGDTGGIKLNL